MLLKIINEMEYLEICFPPLVKSFSERLYLRWKTDATAFSVSVSKRISEDKTPLVTRPFNSKTACGRHSDSMCFSFAINTIHALPHWFLLMPSDAHACCFNVCVRILPPPPPPPAHPSFPWCWPLAQMKRPDLALMSAVTNSLFSTHWLGI